MGDATARFGLPFILPGQAQKELYHNEALVRADALLHAAVETGPLTTPPANPIEGQCWIVGSGASGAWSGYDHHLVTWTEGGWRFIEPLKGLRVFNLSAGFWIHWTGSIWTNGELPVSRIEVAGQQVVGERQSAIVSPSGGTIIDAEVRAAVNQIIATLMSHGLTG